MDNNLRTVKEADLKYFVNTVFASHNVRNPNVSFQIHSFYFDFHFGLYPNDNLSLSEDIMQALVDLHRNGIITEDPMEKLKTRLPNINEIHELTERRELFIHPFNIVE